MVMITMFMIIKIMTCSNVESVRKGSVYIIINIAINIIIIIINNIITINSYWNAQRKCIRRLPLQTKGWQNKPSLGHRNCDSWKISSMHQILQISSQFKFVNVLKTSIKCILFSAHGKIYFNSLKDSLNIYTTV